MYIRAIGTAVPPQSWTQAQCWQAIQRSPYISSLRPGSLAILDKVLNGSSGIDTRHFGLDEIMEVFEDDPDSLHARYSTWAPRLLEQATRECLAIGNQNPEGIDGVIVSTCTGYMCPGLSTYLIEALGLKPEIYFVDHVGHGCGAALPNLALARSLVRSGACRRVLSCCVEVCSAAFYLDDDPGVLISACLFGDGASAVLVADEPDGSGFELEWESYVSHLDPNGREALRFQTHHGLLRNILSPAVPGMVSDGFSRLLEQWQSQHQLSASSMDRWIFHAGGKKVLEALQETHALDPHALRFSYGILGPYGNMSSPSVIFALKNALIEGGASGRWLLSAFGAGFSCFGATLMYRSPQESPHDNSNRKELP